MSLSGFLVVDKPSGPTSFRVVSQVRRALNVKKVGHLGTLDPLATGVLVLGIGQGTKLIEYLMKADKVYDVQLELGKISNTYDSEGEVTVVEASPQIPSKKIQNALAPFVGDIQQVPPVFSAIKIKGKRAYERARRGETVEMKARPVTIHSIANVIVSGMRVSFRVHCSSGTYIRSLVHDLGQALGCGAIMTGLRRTAVGTFGIESSISLKALQNSAPDSRPSPDPDPSPAPNSASEPHPDLLSSLIPLEHVVVNWPSWQVDEATFHRLRSGQPVRNPQDFPRWAGERPHLHAESHSDRSLHPHSHSDGPSGSPSHSQERTWPVAAFYDGHLVSLVERGPRSEIRVIKNFNP